MTIKFNKYQGTGNDFIILDNRENIYQLTNEQVAFLCDRHFGIGADGFMLLENDEKYDFRMRYYNSDGNEASMCGNGGRCLVAFAKSLGIIDKETEFIAVDGVHHAKLDNGIISLKMQDIDEIQFRKGYYFLDTGSPHLVIFDREVEDINVFEAGKKLRYDEEFAPEGTNVNFVQNNEDHIFVRTYERGVENETLSCGTGITASALALTMHTDFEENIIPIKAIGGDLSVTFNKINDMQFDNIWLNGPATFVFKGEIEI